MVTKEQIRKYINDYATKNKLFVDREFDDSDLEAAIYWASQQAQGVEPFIDNFMVSYVPNYIMLLGCVSQLFTMAALFNIRNSANVSEQGIPVPVGENGVLYSQLADKYEQKFFIAMNKFKLNYNILQAHAYQSSPYDRELEDSTWSEVSNPQW